MPGQEEFQLDQQALRGGLRGRFHGSLDRLDNALEVLGLWVEQGCPKGQEADVRDLLPQIGGELSYLRRLGDLAADAALAAVLSGQVELQPLELLNALRDFCAIYNEETALRGLPGRAVLQVQAGVDLLPTMGEETLLNGLIVNLLSNSQQAQPEGAEITLLCEPGRLVYRDGGPGLSAEACALLLHGTWSEPLLGRGSMGLLLIRSYAQAMGWQVAAHAGPPLEIAFTLPPCRADLAALVLASAGHEHSERRRCLARELDALLLRRLPRRDNVSYL